MYENPTAAPLTGIREVAYAHFSVVGTWANERESCRVCGWHWQTIIPPLLVQWEPSTDVIGDFSWDGPFGYTFIVKNQVAEALKAIQIECEFFRAEHVSPERKRNTVPFPYNGPTLFWGQCSAIVDLDMKASGVTRESSCSACGDVRYTFRNNGIVIRRRQWADHKMFRIATNGHSDATFVSEEGRRIIEEFGCSNIAFTEAGYIVP